MDRKKYLQRIGDILDVRINEYLFPCIEDLLLNGLSQERFAEGEGMPNRQKVTEFLARWCNFTGMSQEQCLDWLTEFALEVLSSRSRSGPSAIRHGTKSMTRYVYSQNKSFLCGCEMNSFHLRCETNCIIYVHQKNEYSVQEQKSKALYESILSKADNENREADKIHAKLKDKYREQYEKALQVIKEEIANGSSNKMILNILLDAGFKSITGKQWTMSLVFNERKKLQSRVDSS